MLRSVFKSWTRRTPWEVIIHLEIFSRDSVIFLPLILPGSLIVLSQLEKSQTLSRFHMSAHCSKVVTRRFQTNYRPVSLLPIISRILEVMVKRLVMVYIDSHHLMPVSQFCLSQKSFSRRCSGIGCKQVV